MENFINPKHLGESTVTSYHTQFKQAKPWNYVVLKDFLTKEFADSLSNNFPPVDQFNVKRKSYNEAKAEEYHLERFHPDFTKLRDFLNSPAMSEWMGKVTGIKGMTSTYDALGTGLHQGVNGSFVDVHLDLNMNPGQNIQRHVNLLIYLNQNWKEEYGGALEVWDKDVKVCHDKVYPYHNTALIMITNDESYHGYSKISIPEDERRKSVYCYYYTPIQSDNFTYRDSRFKARPEEGMLKKMVTDLKETAKINIKRVLRLGGVKSLDFQDKNKKDGSSK